MDKAFYSCILNSKGLFVTYYGYLLSFMFHFTMLSEPQIIQRRILG